MFEQLRLNQMSWEACIEFIQEELIEKCNKGGNPPENMNT